jgi:hypothetical protein
LTKIEPQNISIDVINLTDSLWSFSDLKVISGFVNIVFQLYSSLSVNRCNVKANDNAKEIIGKEAEASSM